MSSTQFVLFSYRYVSGQVYTCAVRYNGRMAKKNPAAVALGRLGGLKGGKARAQALTAERRRQIALKAIRARWGKRRD